MIKLLSFDLDDTLWPCMVTIHQAEKVLYQWFQQNHPDIALNFSLDDLFKQRSILQKQNPHLSHNISAIRRLSFEQLAIQQGYSQTNVEAFVKNAFNIYHHERNQISLYDDVLYIIQDLALTYPLYSLSNGNASLPMTPTPLANYFDYSLSAEHAGIEKPHPNIYNQLIKQSQCKTEEILHIGDDPITDIFGAKNVGMKTLWLNREQREWPSHLPRADYELNNLSSLPLLLKNMPD